MPATQFTTTEAAALLDLPERQIRKEFEHGLLGRSTRPRLALPGLVYLQTLRKLGLTLGVRDRKKILAAIRKAMKASPRPDMVRVSDVMSLHVGPVVQEITDLAKQFEAWKQRLVTRNDILGGEPVFAGSRLAVRHVGFMVERGESTKNILEDYPYLTDHDVAFAQLFARAYPRVGRPRVARQAPAR
jgi:uncharacterized protein (DUF433 family)